MKKVLFIYCLFTCFFQYSSFGQRDICHQLIKCPCLDLSVKVVRGKSVITAKFKAPSKSTITKWELLGVRSRFNSRSIFLKNSKKAMTFNKYLDGKKKYRGLYGGQEVHIRVSYYKNKKENSNMGHCGKNIRIPLPPGPFNPVVNPIFLPKKGN